MNRPKETYLGDGLYASDDGWMFWLRAPREDGDHRVALESEVLDEFFRFIEKSRGVKITVEKWEPCRCGHAKPQHIYEEGACRPGFMCDCKRFEPIAEGMTK